jgi:Transglutaminase-like superfamily
VDQDALDFYATPASMSALPDDPTLGPVPDALDAQRSAVQGLLLHRDLAGEYGVTGDAVRLSEQHLRSVADVLARAVELSPEPLTVVRAPADRVLGICRHFALLHTALLRDRGVPARVRCGFASYFEPDTWVDHWITERWQGDRWVRDDPQVDDLVAERCALDFDAHDQPPGRFLTGAEAWALVRAGDADPQAFGIFDMWGEGFLGGNVIGDFSCLNKVEMLPWDHWGMKPDPRGPVTDDAAAILDEVAALATSDDTAAIRDRFRADDRLGVPTDVTSFQDGRPVAVHLAL